MWMAGMAAGAAALIAGFALKDSRLKKILKIAGIALLLLSLVYGGLVLILLGGID